MSEPTVPSSLPGRQPITTASIVRTRLILTMPTRSPGSSGASWRLAITPSACCSHGSASAGSSVQGVRSTGCSTQPAEPVAALGLGQLEQHVVVEREQVEGDEARRRLLGEHVDARLGGVDALAERVEVLAALVVEEHDLAVEHVAARREAQLGEVARQRLAVARLQVDVAAVDEGDGAEAVPLGLVHPAVSGRERLAVLASWGRTGGDRGSDTAPRCYRCITGRSADEALADRGALVEAGPGIDPELRGQRVDRTEDGQGEPRWR